MRIALAGVGHWHARMHCEAARAAGAEVVAAWDEDAAAARRFGAGVKLVADIAALLDTRPGLVVVMGRPDSVIPTALACLDAGVPLILEKPAAVDAAGLMPVVQRSAGRFVAVPLPNRLGPIWPVLDDLARAGRVGALSHAAFRIVNGPPERYRIDGVPWLLDPAQSGGGALRNLGIHGIDAARQLAAALGTTVSLRAARFGRIHGEAVEDYALLTLALAGGGLVTVEAGYSFASMQPGGDYEWRVLAANATLIDRGDAAEAVTLDDATRRALPPIPPSARYTRFMADTLACLAAGRPPSVGIDDYLAAMTLIDAAYAMNKEASA